MKLVKLDHHYHRGDKTSDLKGDNDKEKFVVPPDMDCNINDAKDDEEMSQQHHPAKVATTAPTNNALMKLLMGGNGTAGYNNHSATSATATASKMAKMNDVTSSSTGFVCCHVCGGQGGDGEEGEAVEVENDHMKHYDKSNLRCNPGSSGSGGNNCAISRSIASYFQVTKKQLSSSSDNLPKKSPTFSSSSSRKKASLPQKKISSSASSSSSSSGKSSRRSPSSKNNKQRLLILSPCRYCDRPTCNAMIPPCIKLCEECQQYFCSFCCKVNYDGMYEKIVCFECDELILLSHCCDRMEL
jgi:hypothetical protein